MKSRAFDGKQASSIHGVIQPEEVRAGDPIYARVRFVSNGQTVNPELRVWQMSSLGVDLVDDATHPCATGSLVDLELTVGRHTSSFSGLTVAEVSVEKNLKLLHIPFASVTHTEDTEAPVRDSERRTSRRWHCSTAFVPTATCQIPSKFKSVAYFTVSELSKKGLCLVTSLRNKRIVPKMMLDCVINFPTIAAIKLKVRIESTRVEEIEGKPMLILGAAFESLTKTQQDMITKYLVKFSDAHSLSELAAEGPTFSWVSEAVEYRYVQTEAEYQQVLALRYTAYKAADKLKPGATIADMGDEYDTRSRIIIGVYKGEVVASARLIFNGSDEPMEQEKFVEWPAHLPRREEMVEIMRACTKPDFRGGDLLLGMFGYMALPVGQSDRRYVLICATDSMVKFYARIGFTMTGLSYNHTALNGLKHHVMLGSFNDGLLGKVGDFVTWNLIWSGASKFLISQGILEPDLISRMRLGLYRALAPVAKLIYLRAKARSNQSRGVLRQAKVKHCVA